MRKRFLAMAAVAALTTVSQSTMWEFTSLLSGLNEVPPNGSSATGTAMGTYDDITNMFMMDTVGSNFSANVTAAHIHLGAPGVAGPIVFPLSGATGGTSYTAHDMFVFTEVQEADFLGGQYYVNIHSTQFPGGEIRGQLEPTVVPEPATFVGLIVGTAILLGMRRRR